MNPTEQVIIELQAQIQKLTERLNRYEKSDRFVFEKNIQILDGHKVQLGRTTGTMFGSAADQKISFLGATPRGPYTLTNPNTAAEIGTALKAFGLCA